MNAKEEIIDLVKAAMSKQSSAWEQYNKMAPGEREQYYSRLKKLYSSKAQIPGADARARFYRSFMDLYENDMEKADKAKASRAAAMEMRRRQELADAAEKRRRENEAVRSAGGLTSKRHGAASGSYRTDIYKTIGSPIGNRPIQETAAKRMPTGMSGSGDELSRALQVLSNATGNVYYYGGKAVVSPTDK